jgi:3-deoxy-D-manno-octulosonate 8-phosphate phosphatase (KDO 8-P phosphatase)
MVRRWINIASNLSCLSPDNLVTPSFKTVASNYPEHYQEIRMESMVPQSPIALVIDVDGVMTDGKFYYTAEGKLMKVFGADDHDGLSLLKQYLEIVFVTGDQRGFDISKARIVNDMKMPLELVSTIKRIDWIRSRWDPKKVIYIGDGIFDHYVFKEVGYSIAPASADVFAKEHANYVTAREGGDRAVAEASLHILEKFFTPYDRSCLPDSQIKLSGQWAT